MTRPCMRRHVSMQAYKAPILGPGLGDQKKGTRTEEFSSGPVYDNSAEDISELKDVFMSSGHVKSSSSSCHRPARAIYYPALIR